MLTDDELREVFEPLDREPATAEIEAVVRAARTRRHRPWAAVFVAFAAAAAAAAVLAIVALPLASDEREAPVTAGALLSQAAGAAREQPAFTGYRYTEVVIRYRTPLGGPGIPFEVVEQRRETWVDRDWRGHEIVHRGRILEGRRDPASEQVLRRREGPFAYGDAPKAFPAELPTEPHALRRAIVASLHPEDMIERPSDPVPKEVWLEYLVVRRVILLLELANTTPELRAGLWGVLALAPGVEAAPGVRDPLGRPGEAITIPNPASGGGRLTVILDPATSALLHWSEEAPGTASPAWERHTVLRSEHVAEIGERAAGP